jgi:hypothetical protein
MATITLFIIKYIDGYFGIYQHILLDLLPILGNNTDIVKARQQAAITRIKARIA